MAQVEPRDAFNASRTVDHTYKKISQLEHVLLRPDTYIGSAEKAVTSAWVWSDDQQCMEHRDVAFVPGLYKIFDEILVNAADHFQRGAGMDTLEVYIDEENTRVSVYNNGRGIPIQIHKEEGVYVPELIFGHLLTSSNYDDSEKKVVGGRNGYGAKLANIFSTEFVVETADQSTNRRYRQVFRNNMREKAAPSITEGLRKNEQWTRISFRPDLARFGLSHLEHDEVSLMKKRVYDIAACNPKIKVSLNGFKLPIRSFKDYVNLFFKGRDDIQLVHERCSDRWEVVLAPSDGQFQNVSFVNSIWTMKGGTHVTHVSDQIAARVMDHLTKKNKGLKLKPFQVKNQLCLFVNCLIENPAFDSQTKENLTSKSSSFGSKCEISEDFFKRTFRSNVMENILSFARFKQSNELKRTDGLKQRRLLGIPKLDDANLAGTKDSAKCTLILTEGDSAKSLAVSGFSIVGRDYYGVFPLRGKLLNVRDAAHNQIMDNAEISNLKKILGLQHNKLYDRDNAKTLRYGKVVIMTDQDHDGSHIKGLLINFFQHFWPSLIQLPNFLSEFITPIVKCSKGGQERVFFTLPEYQQWVHGLGGDTKGWRIKYYKGLGTSTAQEAKEYFSNLNEHLLDFKFDGDDDFTSIDLAFSKHRVQQRKEWLSEYTEGTYFDFKRDELTFKNFVDKELILFSIADNERSIPSLVDGLKPSQRKVIYACFKRKLRSDVKVAQLAGYISEHAAYHHGEASLMSTIVGLAQNFVGSNNVNLLVPSGQFGTRLQGGKDAASARYIFTRLAPLARLLFPQEDDNVLEYLEDDGLRIEPKYYAPVIPTVLINGTEGIGTGWSSSVPGYNPRALIGMIRSLLDGARPEDLEEPIPWFRQHRGTIRRTGATSYENAGVVRRLDTTRLVVTELPAKSWTTPYKEWLESMVVGAGGAGSDSKEPPFLQNVCDQGTENDVRFILELAPDEMQKMEEVGVHKRLKLTANIATSNLVLFDAARKLRRYDSALQILVEFFSLRLELYEKRRLYLLRRLQEEAELLENKVRFILLVVDGKLVVARRKKADLVSELQALRFKPQRAQKDTPALGGETENEDEDDGDAGPSATAYDYLLSMPLWSLTLERVERLVNDRDAKLAEMERTREKSAHDLYRVDLEKVEAGLDELDRDTSEQRSALHKAARVAAIEQKRGKAKPRKAAAAVAAAAEEEAMSAEDDLGELVELPAVKAKTTRRAATTTAAEAKRAPNSEALPSCTKAAAPAQLRKLSGEAVSFQAYRAEGGGAEPLQQAKIPAFFRGRKEPFEAPLQNAGTAPMERASLKPMTAVGAGDADKQRGTVTTRRPARRVMMEEDDVDVAASLDNGSDEDFETTLTQRLAQKMTLASKKLPKAATEASREPPQVAEGQPAKRGRKPRAASAALGEAGPAPVPPPATVTPVAKRSKTRRAVDDTKPAGLASDLDAEGSDVETTVAGEQPASRPAQGRPRRARRPAAYTEVVDVDRSESSDSDSFVADADSDGSDYL